MTGSPATTSLMRKSPSIPVISRYLCLYMFRPAACASSSRAFSARKSASDPDSTNCILPPPFPFPFAKRPGLRNDSSPHTTSRRKGGKISKVVSFFLTGIAPLDNNKDSGTMGKLSTWATLPSPTSLAASSPINCKLVGRMGFGKFNSGEKASALTL